VAAVRRFQQASYIDADGALSAKTVAALNVPLRQRIDQVRVNLERARWLLHEFRQGDMVIVDIAGYRIAYMHDGQVRWRSRVQIGKEYRPTPIFKSAITRVTLSPGWVIPPTILQQDTLPAIRRNIGYLARNRLHVYDQAGKEIAPAAVDWARPGRITLRQEPGANGSLGEVVIRFANPYAIYLHDTPHKAQFNNSQRATSSGCIRVQNIHQLAVLLLDDPQKWNREAMQKVIDERKTREVALKKPVPILLAYWTVDVDNDGYVSFKPDVYKRDGKVLAALDKSG
jgi:murein L,D-transpeptidase YcbB/YkuD